MLTEDTALINSASAHMGKLSALLAWHQADPVDGDEQLRNDLVGWIYQTNRNPFVDHPEWVNLTFAPPYRNRPLLNITLAQSGIVLSWLATNQSTRLEYATNLPSVWNDSSVTPALSNGQFVVHSTNAVPRVFSRLAALEIRVAPLLLFWCQSVEVSSRGGLDVKGRV